MHNKQEGISFIEILILLLFMSLFMTFVVPRFVSKQDTAKKKFVAQFTSLIQDTLYGAIMSKSVHQVFFDFDQHTITTKQYDPNNTDTDKHKKFSPLALHMQIPHGFDIVNFFIQGIDEVKAGKNINTSWFYIMPDGTSQAIIININDLDSQSTNAQFSLSINPFYSQVTEHGTFQFP